jgi:hypothetical protein
MISQPLRLRHGKAPLRQPAAWLVPGADPCAWLEEVLRWGVPHTDLVLRVVPHALDDLRPRGVLVTAGAGAEPKVSRCCLAYGRLAGRLFLPVEAALNPDTSETELAALLGPGEYILHPSAGLVGFEKGDLLRLTDLLRRPAATGRTWDRAVPGVTFARRLTFLAPEEVPTVEALLQQGRDDIGSSSGKLGELPPTAEEEAEKQGGRGRRALGRFMEWLGGKGSAANREALEEKRRRELERLMQLLEKDPDQGLRFALPMGGKAHRGLAPPSDKLGRRDVSFNLNRLGGGQPADFWDVQEQQRNRLIARYRELADREVRLGRHRRAAYIYAELLGDFVAAATALSAGGHWREAAILYRDKLQRPWDAARCLESGGLWAEAVALYEEFQAFEKAGDLYARLEQREEAAAMYDKAVVRHRAFDDFLAAARVLDEKLKDADGALAELTAGWPASAQAGDCLRGVFRLLGRLGRHEEVQARLGALVREAVPAGKEMRLVDILAEMATKYPDRGVQAVAADGTRVVAARLLPAANHTDTRQLLDAVARLEPQDRLLSRDCARYAQQSPASARPAPSQRRGRTLALVGRVQLPGSVVWQAVTWSRDVIYAAGHSQGHYVFVRCRPDGSAQEDSWKWKVGGRKLPILLAAHPLGDEKLQIHLVGTVPMKQWFRGFPANDAFSWPVSIGSSAGLSEFTVASVRTPQGITWLLDLRNEMLTLIGLGPNDEPLTTRLVAPVEGKAADPSAWVGPWPLSAHGESIYVGFGDRLLIFTATGKPEVVEVGHRILRLCSSAPDTLRRIAMSCEEGGVLYWGADSFPPRGPLESFATGLARPVVNFTAAGDLVAVDQEGCEVYASHQRSLKLKAEMSGWRPRPLAVLPLPKPDQFALFLETGEIAVYQVPSG